MRSFARANLRPAEPSRSRVRFCICGGWLAVYGNVVIFDVADAVELHEMVTSMPLFPFMDIEVMPLVRHPMQGGPADSMTPER